MLRKRIGRSSVGFIGFCVSYEMQDGIKFHTTEWIYYKSNRKTNSEA
jgi:hypothetical protein